MRLLASELGWDSSMYWSRILQFMCNLKGTICNNKYNKKSQIVKYIQISIQTLYLEVHLDVPQTTIGLQYFDRMDAYSLHWFFGGAENRNRIRLDSVLQTSISSYNSWWFTLILLRQKGKKNSIRPTVVSKLMLPQMHKGAEKIWFLPIGQSTFTLGLSKWMLGS